MGKEKWLSRQRGVVDDHTMISRKYQGLTGFKNRRIEYRGGLDSSRGLCPGVDAKRLKKLCIFLNILLYLNLKITSDTRVRISKLDMKCSA